MFNVLFLLGLDYVVDFKDRLILAKERLNTAREHGYSLRDIRKIDKTRIDTIIKNVSGVPELSEDTVDTDAFRVKATGDKQIH